MARAACRSGGTTTNSRPSSAVADGRHDGRHARAMHEGRLGDLDEEVDADGIERPAGGEQHRRQADHVEHDEPAGQGIGLSWRPDSPRQPDIARDRDGQHPDRRSATAPGRAARRRPSGRPPTAPRRWPSGPRPATAGRRRPGRAVRARRPCASCRHSEAEFDTDPRGARRARTDEPGLVLVRLAEQARRRPACRTSRNRRRTGWWPGRSTRGDGRGASAPAHPPSRTPESARADSPRRHAGTATTGRATGRTRRATRPGAPRARHGRRAREPRQGIAGSDLQLAVVGVRMDRAQHLEVGRRTSPAGTCTRRDGHRPRPPLAGGLETAPVASARRSRSDPNHGRVRCSRKSGRRPPRGEHRQAPAAASRRAARASFPRAGPRAGRAAGPTRRHWATGTGRPGRRR